MKPTNNKAPKSWAIRKWSIPESEIKKIAKELTEKQVIQEVQAPKIKCERKPIKPVVTPWNYEVYAAYLQAMIDENETATVSTKDLAKIFPQCKHAKNIAQNLKRTYGINYRYSDLWEYVFFDGETKDETVDRLEQEKKNWEGGARYLSQVNNERHETYTSDIKEQQEVIHGLQSDLYNTQYQRNRLFFLVILLIIIITLTNYYG